jgi:hypothetical protein
MECEELTLSKRCQHSYGQVPYTIWSIWSALSTLYRLCLVILAAVTIHSLISATVVLKRARALKILRGGGLPAGLQGQVSMLHNRCANLQQVLGATFYLLVFHSSSVCKMHQSSWEMVANYLFWRFSTISFSTFSLPQMYFSYFSSCTFFNGWYRDVCKQ